MMPSLSRLNSALAGVAGSAIHAAAITALVFAGFGHGPVAGAAETPPEPATSAGLSAAQLVELVGPVALYPDELLAIVLPASTWPLQIVQAARFLKKHESDPELEPDEEWDTSVLGLLNYPEVINLMNEDLNWTWQLGEAVTNQQEEIMDAIQDFRGRAYGAGNLESNEHMTVTTEVEASDDVAVTEEPEAQQQIIVIESTSPEVIFVPVYQPRTVVVVHTTPFHWRWWGPWPVHWRPAAVFWTGMFVGSAVAWHMSWGRRGHSSIRINRNVNINVNRPARPSTPNRPNRPDGGRPGAGGGDRWNPDRGSGGRPGGDRAAGARDRAGTGARDRAGAGTGARDRAGAGTGARDRAGAGTGARDRAGTGQTRGAQTGRASGGSGRALTSGSQRSSRGSSFGSYGSGSRTRASSSRGSSSRAGSRGGSRGGGARRGGGGRRR